MGGHGEHACRLLSSGRSTADIQAGIERHIEEQARLGGGYFRLPFKDRELRLKLVRVHTEYLANLGPGGISPVWTWRT